MNAADLTTLGWYIATFVLGLLTSRFLPAYMWEKGKNLATKEDISAITREVEKVRAEYAEKMENLAHQNRQILERDTRKQQLRMAALDKRLEVSQQAYSLWVTLVNAVHRAEEVGEVSVECQEWWFRNCLYLDPESREAFRVAYRVAPNHQDLLRNRENVGLVQKNWDDIVRAGDAIVKSVELPTIADVALELKEKADRGERK